MTKLFTEILELNKSITGWCSEQKAITLASLVVGLRPDVIVEVGTWQGKSLVPMALALRETGKGVVYAVDPWSAEASVEGMVHPADREWWSNQGSHDQIYEMFRNQIHQLKLQNVKVIRRKSDDFDPPGQIDMLSLDGNHGEQVLRDVERYASKISLGGVIVVDDLGWSGNFVDKAMNKLSEMGFVEKYRVHEEQIWAVLQRLVLTKPL